MKILLTYDFIITKHSIGKVFCEKLNFIKKILSILEIDVEVDDNNYNIFSIQTLCSNLNQPYKNNKFEIIDTTNICENSIELIKEYINDYDFLITYELSTQTKIILDKLDIKYIDIWMSPIRFHKDIMFSFYSNDKSIQEQITKYAISNTAIQYEADKLINHIRYFKKNNFSIKENSALIIGQLFQDKAVLKGSKFLTLVSYINEIENFASKYNKMYLLKHPLMSEKEFEIIVKAFAHIKNVEYLVDINIYSLLAAAEIKGVIGISSSVLVEAKYFKKNIHYLFQPLLNDSYTHIFKSFFQVDFWSNILNLKTNKTNLEFLNYDNYLRYTFNAFYAYDKLMLDKKCFDEKLSLKVSKQVSYNSPVEIYDFISTLDMSKKYILYGYGSIAKLILPHIKNNIKGIIDKNITQSKINGFKVFSIHDLTAKDNVIITPFKYQEEIELNLLGTQCNIIKLA